MPRSKQQGAKALPKVAAAQDAQEDMFSTERALSMATQRPEPWGVTLSEDVPSMAPDERANSILTGLLSKLGADEAYLAKSIELHRQQMVASMVQAADHRYRRCGHFRHLMRNMKDGGALDKVMEGEMARVLRKALQRKAKTVLQRWAKA